MLHKDSVLLIRRGKAPRIGEWSLPGGSQNIGETVRETARREVREETAIEIGPPRFLEVVDAIIPDESGRVKYHYTLVDFWAEWKSGEITAGDDATHVEWIPLKALDSTPLWETTRRVILDAFKARGLADSSGR